MNVNTMQHLNDGGLTKGQELVSVPVRNVQLMVQLHLPSLPSENALVVGMTTLRIFLYRGNLVES
jgi:hypothetical protein